jgi:hypothetical protein
VQPLPGVYHGAVRPRQVPPAQKDSQGLAALHSYFLAHNQLSDQMRHIAVQVITYNKHTDDYVIWYLAGSVIFALFYLC